MKNANNQYQAKFRKKLFDEKERVAKLFKINDAKDFNGKKHLLKLIARDLKILKVQDNGKINFPNYIDQRIEESIIERIEYLYLTLRKTANEDLDNLVKKAKAEEKELHKSRLKIIESKDLNYLIRPFSSRDSRI